MARAAHDERLHAHAFDIGDIIIIGMPPHDIMAGIPIAIIAIIA
ncbi:hypothetical protein [Anaeromyxobacter oryzae]|nr:hypothetical protein [Anaeromyxobacter oryzae]